MATSSFDKHFVLTTQEEVNRFYESLNTRVPVKKINRITTSLAEEREVVEKLKLLLSR